MRIKVILRYWTYFGPSMFVSGQLPARLVDSGHMVLILFAFLAGVVTILAPCILPILPIVLSGGVVQGRGRPWGIIVGVVVTFSFFTLAIAWLVQHVGLSPNLSRDIGIGLLLGIGTIMVVPRWLERVETRLSRIAQHGPSAQAHGFFGGVVLGVGLGAVWTPCAGPILASLIAATQTGQLTGTTVVAVIAYAIGAALPMGVIAWLGQRATDRFRWLRQHAQRLQQTFGVIILVLAVMMIFNLDQRVQTSLVTTLPRWLPSLQSFEEHAMTNTSAIPPSTRTSSQYRDYGLAPELQGITGWINSSPETLADLRGHVVMVKFWTYSCINCIRTLPYVQAWYEKYHSQGFDIIAIHTPEFEFEKVPANVEQAVKQFKITYPVALDPDYATWTAYANQYWPAEYLIDADGHIRYVHFGEGDYDVTEKAIQDLLTDSGRSVTDQLVQASQLNLAEDQTPETYFGTNRAQTFTGTPALTNGQAIFSSVQDLTMNHWSLAGSWTVGGEHIDAGVNGQLNIRVKARDVYFVLGNTTDTAQPLNVEIDGQRGLQFSIAPSSSTEPGLYRLAEFSDYSDHLVTVSVPKGGIEFYTATFGAPSPGLACGADGRCDIQPLQ